MNIKDAIINRRSVRTFDGNHLSGDDINKLQEYIKTLSNPFGIDISFYILDCDKYNLSSPVIVGEKSYILGKVKKQKNIELAFGYSFEMFVLYATSLNIGTTWIAGTFKREIFEKAIGLQDDEIMPCVSPLGYISSKMSLRESIMRKSIGANKRYDYSKLFFDKSFDNPIDISSRDDNIKEALEMVRLAPSAVNKQPWRIIIDGNRYHFYEKHDKGYITKDGYDLQKVDIGISMSHFDMYLKSKGINISWIENNPNIETPNDIEYIGTYEIDKIVNTGGEFL